MSATDYHHGETVDRLLAEAEELIAAAETPDEALENDDLRSLAAEAREVVEGAEPAELLDAVGLDTSEEGGLARALSGADAESLVRLRRLQLLADVDRDDRDDESAIREFQALGDALDGDDADAASGDYVDLEDIDLFGDDSGEEASDGGAADEEEREDDGEENRVEGAVDAVKDAAGDVAEAADDARSDEEADGEDATGETEGEEDAGAAQQVHQALSDMVDEVQEKAPDDTTRDTPAEDEDEDDEDEDDGSSGRSTRPPSDRADMRVPPHHSTMPE